MPRKTMIGIVLLAALAAALGDPARCDAQESGVPVDTAAANEPADQDQEETDVANKAQKRRAVILIMLVAGIALTGLLLLIAAIVARGFLREAQYRAETRRQAEFKRSADVLKEAVESSCNDAGDSVPLSERETEIT